ncbi:hypothetical protein DXG03_003819 [Asterophora parasitica]|uniref:GH18 domain-containing protein n=1 Tax=Asterophora parasitica TaxID=117018 RepID=A0A9P7G380_9AGAR|nr:hypothetical protein DXG03_003819 [Asterophora parasitica]
MFFLPVPRFFLSTFALSVAFSNLFVDVAGAPVCGLVPPKGTVKATYANASLSQDVVASAWYPGWLSAKYPPDTISWSKYNVMTFAFADSSVLNVEGSEILPTFVAEAKKNHANALVSIGGWTGSQYFSMAVATEANRTAFLGAVLDLVKKYDLDGIDFE